MMKEAVASRYNCERIAEGRHRSAEANVSPSGRMTVTLEAEVANGDLIIRHGKLPRSFCFVRAQSFAILCTMEEITHFRWFLKQMATSCQLLNAPVSTRHSLGRVYSPIREFRTLTTRVSFLLSLQHWVREPRTNRKRWRLWTNWTGVFVQHNWFSKTKWRFASLPPLSMSTTHQPVAARQLSSRQSCCSETDELCLPWSGSNQRNGDWHEALFSISRSISSPISCRNSMLVAKQAACLTHKEASSEEHAFRDHIAKVQKGRRTFFTRQTFRQQRRKSIRICQEITITILACVKQSAIPSSCCLGIDHHRLLHQSILYRDRDRNVWELSSILWTHPQHSKAGLEHSHHYSHVLTTLLPSYSISFSIRYRLYVTYPIARFRRSNRIGSSLFRLSATRQWFFHWGGGVCQCTDDFILPSSWSGKYASDLSCSHSWNTDHRFACSYPSLRPSLDIDCGNHHNWLTVAFSARSHCQDFLAFFSRYPLLSIVPRGEWGLWVLTYSQTRKNEPTVLHPHLFFAVWTRDLHVEAPSPFIWFLSKLFAHLFDTWFLVPCPLSYGPRHTIIERFVPMNQCRCPANPFEVPLPLSPGSDVSREESIASTVSYNEDSGEINFVR